ncbi:MAG: hypothetical protein LQ343_002043 [Gyalolechia ehrenbergii]|nr:MAG: hypothetical protein LQ343_002043 [Gyalolechia ehrenbergii]
MNSDFQSDAQYFRGKTLTPESPVPLHIPEPSHIPVLQNQIDPVWNLMSTHMDPPLAAGHHVGTSNGLSHENTGQAIQMNAVAASLNGKVTDQGRAPHGHQPDQGDRDYVLTFDNEDLTEELAQKQHADTFPNPSSTAAAQQATSVSAHDTLSPRPQDDSLSSVLNQPQKSPREPSQASPDPSQPTQDASVVQDQDIKSMSGSPGNSDDQLRDGGVNYQALLDNLSPSASTAPSAENVTSITTAAPSTASNVPRPSNTQSPIAALPLPPGLPPRPPPQEKPAIHPNYTTEEDIRSYHYPHIQNNHTPTSSAAQPANPIRPAQGFKHPLPPNASVGSNGLPPPPLATFQQPSPQTVQPTQPSPVLPQSRQSEGFAGIADRSAVTLESSPDEAPWPPELEKLYEEFSSEEAKYVAEGVWDRFPSGSRLFVGTLDMKESGDSRDSYGRLAQISIKNAYGFIQFFDALCSNRALQGEQGSTIRGRKIHLEISKPQKNSRNAAASSTGNNSRSGHGRRSRSPDYERGCRGAGGRSSIDRGVPYGGFSSEMRRRDDYRPLRSPSPRGFRGRDEYRNRDRSPDRYYNGRRSRSRSPYGRGDRYRSRSPRGRDMDDEANLPMPRRDPRHVPEVQMILVDEVDRTFVAYIEKTFRDRGLTCGIFQLPRVSLVAVIKRQIIEGVQAVVKIFRQSQITGKIPLQVFDYSAGVDNVRFEEYNELDAHIAAELVIRAKAARLAPPPIQQPITPSYGAPQYNRPLQPVVPQQAQQPAGAPNIANLITSLDGPALQKLLGAMSQNPQSPHTPQPGQAPTPQQPPHMPDLSSILGNPQQQAHQGYPEYPQSGPPQTQQQSPYGVPTNGQGFANNPALASLLANVGGNRPPVQQGLAPQQHQNQPGQQQHVQTIMEQLARWKQ